MLRTVIACVVSVAITLGVVAAATTSASTTPAPFSPACPSPGYGADGNMGPLFCVIDNPVALRYFASSGRHLFALGPNATPGQVLAALERDLSTQSASGPARLREAPLLDTVVLGSDLQRR